MAHDFDGLRAEMSDERRRQNAERALALLVAADLGELRGVRQVTQEELAERLEIAQSNVSRLERRRDRRERPDSLPSTSRPPRRSDTAERHRPTTGRRASA